jgi:hypothetical protein
VLTLPFGVRGCIPRLVRACDLLEFGHDRCNCPGHGGGDRAGEPGPRAGVGSLNSENHHLPWQPFQGPAEPYRVWDAEPMRAGRGVAGFQFAGREPVDAPGGSRHPLDGVYHHSKVGALPRLQQAGKLTIGNDDPHAWKPPLLDLGGYYRPYPVVTPERIADPDDHGLQRHVRHTVRVRK